MSTAVENMASAHKCYIQTAGGNGYFAVCPAVGCASDLDFPTRLTREEAEADASKHMVTARMLASHFLSE